MTVMRPDWARQVVVEVVHLVNVTDRNLLGPRDLEPTSRPMDLSNLTSLLNAYSAFNLRICSTTTQRRRSTYVEPPVCQAATTVSASAQEPATS